MKFVYGVTAVEQRKVDLLPRTLGSLKAAGFDQPRLFVDGSKDGFDSFDLPVTYRYPKVRTHGNWILSIYELYIRDPDADLYAIFQDDIEACADLRAYLETCKYPERGYWNLFTQTENQSLAKDKTGWFLSNQMGRGALGLVFSRSVLKELLSARHMVDRPEDPKRGHQAVDGGIVTALKKAGVAEWCHSPSLLQHHGEVSSMGNFKHAPAPNFSPRSPLPAQLDTARPA